MDNKPIDNDIDEEMSNETSVVSTVSNEVDVKQKRQDLIAVEETKSVNRLRIIVFFVLFVSTIGVALTVYFTTKNSENGQFEEHFQIDAGKVLEAIGRSIEGTLSSIDMFAVGLVSHARSTNQTWPFVTIPDFPIRASKMLSASDAVWMQVSPVTTPDQRRDWEEYAWKNQGWVNDSMAFQAEDYHYYGPIIYNSDARHKIFGDFAAIPYNSTRLHMPQWQNYPAIPKLEPAYNWDMLSQINPESIYACLNSGKTIFREAFMLADPDDPEQVKENQYWEEWFQDYLPPGEKANEPASDIYYPIVDTLKLSSQNYSSDEMVKNTVVAILGASIFWRDVIQHILPRGNNGIVVVFENPCSPTFTYQIDGPHVNFIGRNDLHDQQYDYMQISSPIFALDSFSTSESKYSGIPLDTKYCPFSVSAYPSSDMESSFMTNTPLVYTMSAVMIFVFTSCIFLIYDCFVERRQKLVMDKAVTTNAIVYSLFPTAVRDQMIHQTRIQESMPNNSRFKSQTISVSTVTNLKGIHMYDTKPLANLYPETTIFFGDIAGFTSWSSSRDASQVFILLETIYETFDRIAKRHKVFKVETIGDCYVAVAGLPEPDQYHAITVAKFARECLHKMTDLVNHLEITLGPDTADLRLRIGLNSGPTTAGVLRGDKSRFQLFGDTVNTASRMESTGIPGCIHVSAKTAELIREGGKEGWLSPREDLVQAKGKGFLKTHFVQAKSNLNISTSFGSDSERHKCENKVMPRKEKRLVKWNTDVFVGLLKRIVAARPSSEDGSGSTSFDLSNVVLQQDLFVLSDVIRFPPGLSQKDVNHDDIIIDEVVEDQLNALISTIAGLYQDNPFHNFDHASHVVLSTLKLLRRIEALDTMEQQSNRHMDSSETFSRKHFELHPLTVFGIAFAALVHDIDHSGLSNLQMMESNNDLAQKYNKSSILEKNSIDVAWALFMSPSYKALREQIFATEAEFKHFREIVVHCVLSTDVFDRDLKAMREANWAKCVKEDGTGLRAVITEQDLDQKMMIIIAQIIQTSDVVHTMEHWKVYQKWNHLLFQELTLAYQAGFSNQDPADFWYEGELRFFDNYIIPLAKNLKICGVFGVSCDELLDYATQNRLEWETKGREIMQHLSASVKCGLESVSEGLNEDQSSSHAGESF